jgi:Mn2+/Fe2+ NRAMP family transporter
MTHGHLIDRFWKRMIFILYFGTGFLVNAAILIMAAADFHCAEILVIKIKQAHSLLNGFLGTRLASIAFAMALQHATGDCVIISSTVAKAKVHRTRMTLRIWWTHRNPSCLARRVGACTALKMRPVWRI